MPSFIDKLKDKADDLLNKNSDNASDDSGDLVEHPTPENNSPITRSASIFDTPTDPPVTVQSHPVLSSTDTMTDTVAQPAPTPASALAPASVTASAAGGVTSSDFSNAVPSTAPAAHTTSANGLPPVRRSFEADGASLAPSASGSIKSSVLNQVDATPSPKNTQQQFQDAFPDINDNDILIEDYRCALSASILLQGIMFISEQRLCFKSNIIGFKTAIVLPWAEIRSIEKRFTAMVIPNAIEVTIVDGTSHLFTSLLSRDYTYDLIEALWTHHKHHPGDSSATAASTDSFAAKDSDAASAISYEDEQGQRKRHKFLDGFKSGLKLPLRKNLDKDDAGGPTEAEKVKEAAMDRATSSANIHAATHYEGDEFKNVALDVVLPTSPEKAFNLFFKDEAFLRPFLEGKEELKEVNIGQWEGNKRELDYIKPLHASVGPKQTHCEISDEIVEEDPEKFFVDDTTTRTEDVPSGKDFSVKTRTVMEWSEEGGTHIKVTTEVAWTKVNRFLRGIIERSAIEGQQSYHKDLCFAVREHIEANPDDFAVEGVKVNIGPKNDTEDKLTTSDSAGGKSGAPASGLEAFLSGDWFAIGLAAAVVFLLVTNLFTLRAMRQQNNNHRDSIRRFSSAGNPEVVVGGVQSLLDNFERSQRRNVGTLGARNARLKGELETVTRHIVELGAKVEGLAREI